MAAKVIQRDKVLQWLERNGQITFREAVFYLDILDVRKRIQELRERGYNIETVTQRSITGKAYGVYKLIQEGTDGN